ncbi:leucine-rich repeat protein [Treponema pedis]|uniref:leucine-rich repeat protein n=1 Tax=Treponema pedis TaxID=409322 RepID=UPI0003F61157|nr:leucine-rich repeat protein [Treponema pedis]
MKKQFIILISLILIFEEIVFAQNSENMQVNETITMADFCSLNLNEEMSVKIQDELSPETIHNLMTACNGDEKGKIGPIDLDLSNCTFKNKECNIFITNLKNVRSLILPKTTKIITCCLASDMETVILPGELKRIEKQAFFRTKLKYIEIPESVQYVGALAFGDIENLLYIKTFNNPYKTKWSSIWNEWNDAKILEGEAYFLPNENNSKEKYGTILFSKSDYHRAFDTVDMEICLDKEPKKSQKAVLHFYDTHNKNERAGNIEIEVKKGKKTITIQKYPAANFFISKTDNYYTVINECSDYWIKLRCELEFSDGTTIPLEGFCYIYEEPIPDSIS